MEKTQCNSAVYLKYVKQEVRSPAPVRNTSNLEKLPRTFAVTLFNVLRKKKYTTVQVKMCVVYKDVVQNRNGYLH
jgi:hypothetical protein